MGLTEGRAGRTDPEGAINVTEYRLGNTVYSGGDTEDRWNSIPELEIFLLVTRAA